MRQYVAYAKLITLIYLFSQQLHQLYIYMQYITSMKMKFKNADKDLAGLEKVTQHCPSFFKFNKKRLQLWNCSQQK